MKVHISAVAFIGSDRGFILIVALGITLAKRDQIAGTVLLIINIQGVIFADLKTSAEVHRRAVAEDDIYLSVGADTLLEGHVAVYIIPVSALQGTAVSNVGHFDIPLVRSADTILCDDLLAVPRTLSVCHNGSKERRGHRYV